MNSETDIGRSKYIEKKKKEKENSLIESKKVNDYNHLNIRKYSLFGKYCNDNG